MRASASLVVAAAISTGAHAINLVRRTDAAPRVVEHAIHRRHISNPLENDRKRWLRKRSDTLNIVLDNEETLYFLNATIGTPAQSFRLQLDTGSSDLWVNAANSSLCEESESDCSLSGTYDAASSSTYTYLNSDFNITYADDSGAAGDYATDTVTLGSATIDNQQFGIGYTSSSEEGVCGIGYTANEAAVAYAGTAAYPNLPKSLLNAGKIATNAYSLWLNDLDANTGAILFGGVNKDKYTGELETLPIIQVYGEYAEFVIALTAVGMNGDDGSLAKDLAEPALLDSGSSLMYLPNNVTESIYEAVGAEYDSSQGAAFIDCDQRYSNDTVDLTFSKPTISVAMSELVIVAGTERGKEICILGIVPAGSSTPVLGDTFLRSAYVVYDLTGNTISLAQTNFNSTTNDILEITNSTLPGATVVADAVTSVAVASGGAIIGGYTSTFTAAAQATATAAVGWNAAMLGAAGAAALLAI